MTELTVGDEIGPFTIEKPISSGGMAFIYRARLSSPKPGYPARVAVKLAKQGYDDFLRDEEEHLRHLYHPCIIRPIPIPTQSGEIWQDRFVRRSTSSEPPLWYMALEYLEGHSLSDLLQRKKRLPFSVAVEIASQVGMALDYLHRARGVAHLDVRPDNVMFRRDPLRFNRGLEVVLCDLGIAWHNRQVPTDSYGSLPYVAPERRRGDAVTSASDVYSVGVMFYEMLTGNRPYPQDEHTVKIAYTGVDRRAPIPPSELCPATPQLDATVLRAIARRPEERYATMSEFLKDLALVALEATARPVRVRLCWKRLVLRGGAVLVLSLLVMLAAFLAGRHSLMSAPPVPAYTATGLPADPAEASATVPLVTDASPSETAASPVAPFLPTTSLPEVTAETTEVTRPPTSTPRPTNTPTPTWTPRPPTPTVSVTTVPGAGPSPTSVPPTVERRASPTLTSPPTASPTVD